MLAGWVQIVFAGSRCDIPAHDPQAGSASPI